MPNEDYKDIIRESATQAAQDSAALQKEKEERLAIFRQKQQKIFERLGIRDVLGYLAQIINGDESVDESIRDSLRGRLGLLGTIPHLLVSSWSKHGVLGLTTDIAPNGLLARPRRSVLTIRPALQLTDIDSEEDDVLMFARPFIRPAVNGSYDMKEGAHFVDVAEAIVFKRYVCVDRNDFANKIMKFLSTDERATSTSEYLWPNISFFPSAQVLSLYFEGEGFKRAVRNSLKHEEGVHVLENPQKVWKKDSSVDVWYDSSSAYIGLVPFMVEGCSKREMD